MPRIEGSAGPSPVSDSYSKSTDSQAATAQVGENKLSDIAKRLKIDANALQQANPNISHSTNLKVGQEVRLPQHESSKAREHEDDDTREKGQASELPRSPIGDPLAKNFIQSNFSEKDLAQVPGGATLSSDLAYGKIKESYKPSEPPSVSALDATKSAYKIAAQKVNIKDAAVPQSFDVLKLKPW